MHFLQRSIHFVLITTTKYRELSQSLSNIQIETQHTEEVIAIVKVVGVLIPASLLLVLKIGVEELERYSLRPAGQKEALVERAVAAGLGQNAAHSAATVVHVVQLLVVVRHDAERI